jgi:hypothetical protein
MNTSADTVTVDPIKHDPDIIPEAYESRTLPLPLCMEIVDGTGDTKLIWDRANPDEVENARQTYDRLKKKRYQAFRVVGEKGAKGESMAEFDPQAERMIMVPAMVGG